MSRTAALLRERSVSYLLEGRWALERTLRAEQSEKAVAYGRILLTQISDLLKLCLDDDDLETFRRVESGWQEIGDPWGDSSEKELASYRELLTFGLAMWAVHRCRETPAGSRAQAPAATALRILSPRFGEIENLFATYERAAEREEGDRVPWGNWFLFELPQGQAHFIPTSPELLFTALLLATERVESQTGDLQPRSWFDWRESEIEQALEKIGAPEEGWAAILGTQVAPEEAQADPAEAIAVNWQRRTEDLRRLIEGGRRDQRLREREELREEPLSSEKEQELRSSLIDELRRRRWVRRLFAGQGALELLTGPPADFGGRVARNWVPKSLLVADSHVVGIDMVGRDLAAVTLNEEAERLLGSLPKGDLPAAPDAKQILARIRDEQEAMAAEGFTPTLVLIPISWRLREALGLPPVGRNLDAAASALVPEGAAAELAGEIGGVPVLEVPQVPAHTIWIVDVPATARFREWMSEGDSGVEFEIESFDGERAEEFLEQNPEVAGEMDHLEALAFLRENVLLSQHLHWVIEPLGTPEAARAIGVPGELVFEA